MKLEKHMDKISGPYRTEFLQILVRAYSELGDLEKAREEFLALVARQLPADGTLGIVVFDAVREPRPSTETEINASNQNLFVEPIRSSAT